MPTKVSLRRRRKLTPSELVAEAKKLEPLIRAAAQAKQAARSTRTRSAPGRKARPGSAPGLVADLIAKRLGKCRQTIRRATAVVDAAAKDPAAFSDLVVRMDKTGKVDAAFREMKARAAGSPVAFAVACVKRSTGSAPGSFDFIKLAKSSNAYVDYRHTRETAAAPRNDAYEVSS